MELGFLEVLKDEIVHHKLKWFIMLVSCMITFGSYYIFDFPGAIGTGPVGTIQEKFVHHNKTYNQAMNLALYSVYSWPNSLLAIFGGILIDNVFGLRKSLILFCALVLIGSGLMWVGVYIVNYPLIVVGRFIFGCGGESLTVAQSSLIARWFAPPKRGLSLAFATGVAVSRVGGSMDFLISPKVANTKSIDYAFSLGFWFCVASFISCIFLVFLDYRGEKSGKVIKDCQGGSNQKFSFKKYFSVSLAVWIVSCTICSTYSSIFPYIGFAENFFQVRFNFTHTHAGNTVALFQTASAIGLPIAGILIDIIGRNSITLIFSLTGLVLFYVGSIFSTINPDLMMCFAAVMYSIMVSSLWTMVPFIVPPSRTGLAYGLMTAVQNFGLASTPLITGAILNANTPKIKSHIHHVLLPTLKGYQYALGVLLACASIALLLSVGLFIKDKRGTGILSASPKQRSKIPKITDEHQNNINNETVPLISRDV